MFIRVLIHVKILQLEYIKYEGYISSKLTGNNVNSSHTNNSLTINFSSSTSTILKESCAEKRNHFVYWMPYVFYVASLVRVSG